MRPRAVQIAVVLAAAVPAAHLGWRAYHGALGAEPIETLTHATGGWALRLLLASLAVTPLRRAFGLAALAPLRRTLGLAAFAYACLHVAVYLVLGWGFDWSAVLEDVAKRPYVTAGATAFACLLPLAATSTRAAQRRLGGARWRRLHRLAYAAAAVAVVHFLWLVKADLREPLLYAAALALLLATRLPALRSAARGVLGPSPLPRR
jgi:sulfoxide reductase heme-binding subunit YedZ